MPPLEEADGSEGQDSGFDDMNIPGWLDYAAARPRARAAVADPGAAGSSRRSKVDLFIVRETPPGDLPIGRAADRRSPRRGNGTPLPHRLPLPEAGSYAIGLPSRHAFAGVEAVEHRSKTDSFGVREEALCSRSISVGRSSL